MGKITDAINLYRKISGDKAKNVIQSDAEKFAKELRKFGFQAEVNHSGSKLGPSSYVNVFDPQTGRFFNSPFRFSNHSKGAFEQQNVIDAFDSSDIDKFVGFAKDLRSKGPTEFWKKQLMAKDQSLRGILDYSSRNIDPDYDNTKVGQKAIREMQVRSNVTGPNSGPEVSLADFEGHPYVTTQSDRLDSGRTITGINNVDFNIPVRTPGGQGYMFENPEYVWASEKMPAQQIIDVGNYLYRETGKQPILIPWRMAPTGGDHAHATGQTMLAYAQAALNKSDKRKFDRFIKEMRSTEKQGNQLLFPDWPGVDSPEAINYFNNSSSNARKRMIELVGGAVGKNKPLEGMDVLRAGQARVAVSDPSQLSMQQGGFQNIGFITPNRDLMENTNNTTYGSGILGEGVGTLKPNQQKATIWDFMTPSMNILDAEGKAPKGLGKQELIRKENIKSSNKLRPYQMKAYGGIIDDKLLKRLDKKGMLGAGGGTSLLSGTDLNYAERSPISELPKGVMDFATSLAEGLGISLLDSIRMIGEYAKFLPGMANMSSIPEVKPSKDKDREFGRMIGGILAPF